MIDKNKCPACDGHKSRKHALCQDCHSIYGDIPSEWPGWLRELVNSNRRLDYQEDVVAGHEVPLGEFVPYDGMEEEGFEQLATRPASEMAMSYGSPGILLPYAPYDDEETNREYRRANGISERDDETL